VRCSHGMLQVLAQSDRTLSQVATLCAGDQLPESFRGHDEAAGVALPRVAPGQLDQVLWDASTWGPAEPEAGPWATLPQRLVLTACSAPDFDVRSVVCTATGWALVLGWVGQRCEGRSYRRTAAGHVRSGMQRLTGGGGGRCLW
jgi:hypothetical protein